MVKRTQAWLRRIAALLLIWQGGVLLAAPLMDCCVVEGACCPNLIAAHACPGCSTVPVATAPMRSAVPWQRDHAPAVSDWTPTAFHPAPPWKPPDLVR